MAYPQTIGVVLAGGLARRMGGGDKARIRIGGVTVLERIIERLRPQCAGLILNANTDAARFADIGLPVVADSVPANEYEETMNKAKAMLKAVDIAEKGF